MNKCRKFVPNIFNKSKCQDCFAPKELHSAEALECNKISRKVSKCGYLFVAPDFDFTNPMDRTRRWQRRFFVLYDDGELTFSVDENPDTVPQGCVDMNKCLDVYDAENVTSHQHSMSVSSQDKTYYIKGTSKDEISRWFDILVMYPRSNIKTKWIRAPSIHNLAEKENQQDGVQSKNNQQNLSEIRKPLETSTVENKSSTYNTSRFTVTSHGPGSIDKGKSRLEGTPFTTHRGVRSLKHKHDRAYQEGLRKSNSMYDLTEDKNSETELVNLRVRSRSRDRLDDIGYLTETNPYATLPRTLRTSRLELSASTEALRDTVLPSRGSNSSAVPGKLDFTTPKFYTNSSQVTQTNVCSRDRSQSSSVGRDQPDASSSPRQSGVGQQKGELTHEELLGSRGNETDELKLAKGDEVEEVDSSQSHSEENLDENGDNIDETEMAKSSEGSRAESSQGAESTNLGELSYTKKGWLIKQGPSDTEWKKHWFALSGESLRYYKDSRAEDHNLVDGRIDLSTCHEVSEASNTRNYGFRIKNQNGEYLLSAMTSGIRNNWVKAVGKCVEYNKQRKSTSLSSDSSSNSSIERSPREDLARSSSESSFKRLSATRDAPTRKLETSKPVRRHYSDLNLRSVGDMVLVEDIHIGNEGNANNTSKGRSREVHRIGRRSLTNDDAKDIKIRFLDKLDSDPSKSSSALDRKTRKSSLTDLQLYRNYSSSHDELTSSSKPPFRRYVEGSDSVAVSSHVTDSMGATKASSRLEDVRNADRLESLRQRAKSPSARVKDKTRAKSPRLHSPPPGPLEPGAAEPEEDGQYMPRSGYKGRSSGPEDNSTVVSTRNSVVEELLEAEVDSLKHQLEKTQQELQDVHMNNSELKSQVQSLRRDHRDTFAQDEPDSSLDYSMELTSTSQSQQRKQNRDAQDTIHRQKMEIDTLKSKLDMSLAKLTKTEEELAKAVNNLKQEKEKFLRLSDDWNARIKTLEDQLRDTATILDTKKEELSSKDSENRRLSNDIKGTLEKLRNSEREILKLKAVERDYKTTKEQLDNMERELGTAKAKLREHDMKLKKVEEEYEKQLDEIEHQFSGDREELEQQLENFQKRLLQAHRQSTIADNVNSDMKDILMEKDEIISQLEEKVIETDGKVEEIGRKLEKSEKKMSKAEKTTTSLEEQNKELQTKLKKAEKELTQLKKLKRESESERASLHRQAESNKKGKSQQNSEIESLKAINSNLNEQNDALQASITVLNNRVSDLQQRCDDKQKEVDKLSRSIPRRPGSGDVLQKYDQAMDEMQQVKSKLVHLEHVLQDYQLQQGSEYNGAFHGLEETTTILRELQKQLEVTNEALKETTLLVDDPVDRPEFSHKITVSKSSSSPAILAEYMELKKKFDKAVFEIKKLKREVKEAEHNYVGLESKEKILREQKVMLEKDYKSQLERMHERVNDLTAKLGATKRPLLMKAPSGLSKELDSQLQTLEHNIEFVESAIKSQDTDTANLQQQIGLVEQQVVRTHETPQTRPSPSTSDEDLHSSTGTGSAASSSLDLSDGDSGTPSTSSQQLTAKLKQMKLQLESTNVKMKDITSKMGDQGTSQVELRSLKQKEQKLQEQIRKYEERLRQLNVELISHTSAESSVLGGHLHRVEEKLSQTETTLENCRAKLSSIISVIESYQGKGRGDSGTDRLAVLKERLVDVMHCVSAPVSATDQETVRKITESQGFLLSNLRNKESESSQMGPLTENQKLCLYAEKLACEAVILGELSYILQKQDSGVLDTMILKEIQDTNFRMFKLEQQLGVKCSSKEGDEDLDVLGSYASLIADKITMEGKLSALTGSKSDEVRNTSVMLSENDPEQNSILAEEVLVRSQIQESMSSSQESKGQPLEPVESYAGLLATRALIQGEITFALAQMKGKIGRRMTDKERSDLVKQELSRALEHLNNRYSVLAKAIGAYRQEKIASLAEMLAIETVNTVVAAGIEGDEQQSVQVAMCGFVDEAVNGVRDQYLKDWNKAHPGGEARQQEKIKQMQLCLKEEFQSALVELKSKYTNILPKITPPSSQLSSLKDEIKTNVAAFSAVLAQYAVIAGSTRYLNALRERKGQTSEGQTDIVVPSEPVQRMKKILGEVIMKEACTKETRASELRGKVRANSGQIADLAGRVPELSGWRGEALAAYADVLLREAVFQAELTYMTLKLKMQHREELQQLHEYYEAKYGRMEDSEGVAESYAECESLLAKPEGTLEDEHSKVAEALKSVEVGIKKLKTTLKSSSSKDLPKQAESLEKLLKQAVSVVRKTQEETTSSILKDMKDAKTKIEEIMDDHEHEKESLVAEYEDRIAQLEEEIDAIKEDHESEFDQLKQDMFTAVSAIRASEVQSEADMSNEIMMLRHQLSSQRAKVMMELKSMRSSIPHSQRNTKLASALLGKIQNVEHILTGFKSGSQESLLELTNQDFSSSSTDEESEDESSEMSEGGEELDGPKGHDKKIDTRVHKRVLLRMHERHKTQLGQLRKEKDKALEGEMKSTKAALEAMSKKYEEELQSERDKFGEALSKLYTEEDVAEKNKKHSLEVEHLKEEVAKLNKKFKKKGEDLRSLEEKLTKSMADHRDERRRLAGRNDQINSNMSREIEKIKSMISKGADGASSRTPAKSEKEDLYNAQVLCRVKETEMKQMKEQLKGLAERTQKAEEGQEQAISQYRELYGKYEALSTEHEEEVERLKRKLEQSLLGFRGEGKKGVRRVSSFNQRDRSPSPQRPGEAKRREGHTSRADGQGRRRYLPPRDLKRSKSSPTLPTVAKLPVIQGKLEENVKIIQRATGLAKSSSSKMAKN